MVRNLFAAFVALLPAFSFSQTTTTTPSEGVVPHAAGVPFTLPRSMQYDFTSRINARTYRIAVSTPFNADRNVDYPVVYVLDGNQYFATATEIVTRLSYPRTIVPALIVAIGYPTEDPVEVLRRRSLDLTPSIARNIPGITDSGGGDNFLRVIEEEIKPLVMSRHRVDRERQTIYGQSLGGLIALRALFRNPTAFSTYIISSPSIWWNNREVLADEEAFAKRARSGELRLKILVTSAGDEQYRGSDPKLLDADRRMVDNASELATRLSALDRSRIKVVRTIFEGETHGSVSPVSLTRGLRFALALD